MHLYTPLGYINMTSMRLKSYVRLKPGNNRMWRDRAELHLNMPNQCHMNSDNYVLHSSQPCLERRGNGLPVAISGKQQSNWEGWPWLTWFVVDSFSLQNLSPCCCRLFSKRTAEAPWPSENMAEQATLCLIIKFSGWSVATNQLSSRINC